jgi:hypothetical protein
MKSAKRDDSREGRLMSRPAVGLASPYDDRTVYHQESALRKDKCMGALGLDHGRTYVPLSTCAMCTRSWCFNPVCGYRRTSDIGATSCYMRSINQVVVC